MAHTLSWREHGIVIHVPKDAVSSSIQTFDIAVVPIAEGDFVIDSDYEPASAVYAIGVSCELQKPLQIEIQHCVELTEESHCKKLTFAKAKHDGITPPYHLDPIPGGSFSTGSDYGTIECSQFALFSILCEGLNSHTRCRLLTFYEYRSYKRWAVRFVVTKNINSHIEVCIDYNKVYTYNISCSMLLRNTLTVHCIQEVLCSLSMALKLYFILKKKPLMVGRYYPLLR